MTSSSPLLDVKDLVVDLTIGKGTFTAVSGVSFKVEEGKTLAIVGESGSGKSITALSLLKIAPSPPVQPPRGEALFFGKNLFSLSEREFRKIRGKEIAMIFQDPMNSLNPVFTIENQLVETALCHMAITEEEAEKKSIEALKAVGLQDAARVMKSYPHELSGGMNQRVMIAMAILCRPKLLIADEPTTALDVTVQRQVLDLLKKLQKEFSMAILLITHDMSVVRDIADDVAVMYAGKIIESGTKDEVFNNPSHPYTCGLFAAMDRTGQKGKLKTIQGAPPSINHIPKGCAFHPRCPFAFEKCISGHVPSFNIDGESNHLSACWLKERG